MSGIRALSVAAAGGLLMMACSSFDDSWSGGGTLVDRGAVDGTLLEITERLLDGADPRQGVELDDGTCPALGDASIADVVNDAGIDFDIEGGGETGFLDVVGQGVTINCNTRTEGRNASLVVVQTPAFAAAEFIDQLARLLPVDLADRTSFETEIEHPDFRTGSLGVRSVDDSEWVIWVDNGLAIAVSLLERGRSVSRDDSLATLRAARDSVLETLQGSADAGGGEPGVADGLDRGRLLEAFDAVEPEVEGPRPESLDEGPCPFLGDEAFGSVADELDWDIESGFQGTVNPSSRTIECRWGDSPEVRSMAISLSRSVSVAETKAFIEGPLFESDWSIDPLDTTGPLANRSYLVDRGSGSPSAGWVDNGLVIQIDLVDGEDPEEVLAVVVPSVLEELGLD